MREGVRGGKGKGGKEDGGEGRRRSLRLRIPRERGKGGRGGLF